MPNCKICSQSALGIPPCQFCKEQYCVSHLLPEVHGCGVECKNAARRDAENAAIEQRRARKHLGNDAAREALAKRLAAGEAERRKKGPKGKK